MEELDALASRGVFQGVVREGERGRRTIEPMALCHSYDTAAKGFLLLIPRSPSFFLSASLVVEQEQGTCRRLRRSRTEDQACY